MKKIIGVFFTFEKLNSTVLMNYVMHDLSLKNYFVVAYVPPGFRSLAFFADVIQTYPKEMLGYQSYAQCNEYVLSQQIIGRLRDLLFKLLRKYPIIYGRLLLGLMRLVATPRAKKYFYESGLYKWALRDIKNIGSLYGRTEFQYIITHDFIEHNGSHAFFSFNDLGESFHRRFNRLAELIQSGVSINKHNISKIHIDSPIVFTPPPPLFNITIPYIVLRTRNYKKKATIHNSQNTVVSVIVERILAAGYLCFNVGSPPMRAPIFLNDKNYHETEGGQLDEEMQLLVGAQGVVTEGGAGLFTLMALVENNTFLMSKEWSVDVFKDAPVSLIESRRKGSYKVIDSDFDDKDILFRFDSWINQIWS